MTYQVLARKWRPQDFSAIIGQEPIVTALRNALREGRIAQAYLFAGIRGVGKTTAARVLAKALNCENGPAEDPCNECATCTGITAGADLDVLEIDAATYSKVEQVRELTESLKYGPANDRYKVVVLDEVHRLSRQAFDALLKIVEEPPKHLTFIFATTEVDAVPATILSRCQEFHFRRVPAGVLAAHLEKLCAAEQIEASSTALRLIARAGEGSVRDSVALLDQLATFGNGVIDDQEAVRLLGGLDIQLFENALRAVFASDHAAIAAIVHEIEDRGWDPRSAFTQLLAYCRDGLHLATQTTTKRAEVAAAEAAGVDLPDEAVAALRSLVEEAGFENLLRLVHLLLGAELTIKRSEMPGLALEVALLRAAELPKVRQIETLLREAGGTAPSSPDSSGSSGPSQTRANAVDTSSSASAAATSGADAAPREAPREARSGKGTPLSTATDSSANPTSVATARSTTRPQRSGPSSPVPGARKDFLAHLRRKPSLAAHLDEIEIEIVHDAIEVKVPSDDTVVADLFEHHRQYLEQGARHCLGSVASLVLGRSSSLDSERPDAGRTQPATQGPKASENRDASGGSGVPGVAEEGPNPAVAESAAPPHPTARREGVAPGSAPRAPGSGSTGERNGTGAVNPPNTASQHEQEQQEEHGEQDQLPLAVSAVVEVFGGRVIASEQIDSPSIATDRAEEDTSADPAAHTH